jgi:hypothetical protein
LQSFFIGAPSRGGSRWTGAVLLDDDREFHRPSQRGATSAFVNGALNTARIAG